MTVGKLKQQLGDNDYLIVKVWCEVDGVCLLVDIDEVMIEKQLVTINTIDA